MNHYKIKNQAYRKQRHEKTKSIVCFLIKENQG